MQAQRLHANAIGLGLFVVLTLTMLLRFFVPAQVLNAFMPYTSEGGAFYQKLHWGTYGLCVVAACLYGARPLSFAGNDARRFRALLVFALAMIILVGAMLALGRANGAGFVIDTYLAAALAALALLAFAPPARQTIGTLVLAALALSAAIAMIEAVMGKRLFPFPLDEAIFRPTGLAEHPLTLGMLCAAGIGFAAAAPWRAGPKISTMALLFGGVAASGARFATLLAAALIVALVLFTPWARARTKLTALVLMLVFGGALAAVLVLAGGLSRFESALVDENFWARITVYQVFGLAGWPQIVWGADLNEVLVLVNQKLGLPFIESTPVVLVFQFGLILAIAFAIAVFRLFGQLLKGASPAMRWAAAAFFLCALSNNTLSTKTPVVAIAVVLIIAFAPARPAVPNIEAKKPI